MGCLLDDIKQNIFGSLGSVFVYLAIFILGAVFFGWCVIAALQLALFQMVEIPSLEITLSWQQIFMRAFLSLGFAVLGYILLNISIITIERKA